MKTSHSKTYLCTIICFFLIILIIEVFCEGPAISWATNLQTGAIEMVSVPAGTFVMGRRDDGDDATYGEEDELPRHDVTLSAYHIGKYEVTNRQYCDVLLWAKAKGYLEDPSGGPYVGGPVYKDGFLLLDISSEYCQIRDWGWTFSCRTRDGYPMEYHPVVKVTWHGAVAFCNWLSEKEGLPIAYDFFTWDFVNKDGGGYRLPTEAEWERAAAWDGTKHWIYGFTSDTLTGKNRCNYYDANPNCVNPLALTSAPYTSPVGWFDGINISPNGDIQTIDSPSPVGAYDMSGNVQEWCHDWYSSTYYSDGATSDAVGPGGGINKVVRGGNCDLRVGFCRSAERYYYFMPDDSYTALGFRVVRSGVAEPPIPTPIIHYTFDTSDEDWVFYGEIPPYDIPASEATEGHIGISPSGSVSAFSYWYSPDIKIEDNRQYKVTWVVSSDAYYPNTAPQFRLRVNQKGSWQSWNQVVPSNLYKSPWLNNNKIYEVFINPQITLMDDDLLVLSFDLLSFDSNDDNNSWLYLDSVILEEEWYREEKEVVQNTFETSEDGWSFPGKITPYDEPLYSSTEGHLGLNADGSIHCYSYWLSPNVCISDSGYYRAQFEVSSSSSNPDTTLQFRLRASQKDSWQGWERVVNSNNHQAPSASETKTYDVIFNPTVMGAGSSQFVFSFDILSFNRRDDIFSWLYLESFKIHKILDTVPPIMQMITVPTGSFVMGRRDDGADGEYGEDDELPRHDVTLSTYAIGKYEVTNRQYCDVLNWALSKGYLEDSSRDAYSGGDVYKNGKLLIELSGTYCQIQYAENLFTSIIRDGYSMEDHPVGEVSWYGAVAFCNWLSEKDGLPEAYDLSTWKLTNKDGGGYRLPTEAEWERAAAWDGTKHWIYCFGSDILSGKNRCNYYDNNPNYVNPLGLPSFPFTSPVGWFDGMHISPNGNIQTIDSQSPIGAYDMSGNAWEWCHDWYTYYSEGAMTDPTGPTNGTNRVVRGGACSSNIARCRSAYRFYLEPDNSSGSLSFRVVRTTTLPLTPTPTPTPDPNEITVYLPGDVPLTLVSIPAGSFQMGSPETERSRHTNEGPVHTVNIDYPFYIGKYEVTQQQWVALIGRNPSSGYGIGDTYPVYNISWGFCQVYIIELNTYMTDTGQGAATFRLPSESEWEYACRAGTSTRFFFGDSLGAPDDCSDAPAGTLPGNRTDYMWYCGDNSPYGTKPVGLKAPNQFGLYDMNGNVGEWCQDWYHSSYNGAPTDGSAWEIPSTNSRIHRGGHWANYASECRSANRSVSLPINQSPRIGLRVVWIP